MEIKSEWIIEKLKKREEGPTQNQKWGILKHLSAEFFSKKSKTIQGKKTYECRILGQKLGYDNDVETLIWFWRCCLFRCETLLRNVICMFLILMT